MKTRRPATNAGFTLLELLIALALVTLIVSLLFGGMRLANRSWNAADSRAERQAENRLVWRFLHDRLGQTQEVIREIDGKRTPVFWGDDQGFEFVSPMPAHLGVSGLYLMRIQRNRDALTLTRWLYHDDILDGPEGIPEWKPLGESTRATDQGPDEMRAYYSQSRLVEGLEKLEIEYFGYPEGDSQARWMEEWEEPQLPKLVRIQLSDKARGRWPEILFEVGGG